MIHILPVRIFDGHTQNDPAMDYWIFELETAGIYYAVHHGAHIIQIGGALKSSNPIVAEAVRYAYYHNIVICTSAGNFSRFLFGLKTDELLYRSFDNELLLIGGVGMEDNKMRSTWFTIPNVYMDVAAPAEHIFIILPSYMGAKNRYGDGTSMSSPIAAGVVALMRSAAPPQEKILSQPAAYCRLVSKCIRETASMDIKWLVEPNDVIGKGVIDAYAAVKMIKQELDNKK